MPPSPCGKLPKSPQSAFSFFGKTWNSRTCRYSRNTIPIENAFSGHSPRYAILSPFMKGGTYATPKVRGMLPRQMVGTASPNDKTVLGRPVRNSRITRSAAPPFYRLGSKYAELCSGKLTRTTFEYGNGTVLFSYRNRSPND